MGVKEEESSRDNRDPLWKWMHPLRMERHTQGREIIRLPLVYSAAKCYDWSRARLFINVDHILPEAGFSYTTLRIGGKSTLQFHLKFISICQLQFILRYCRYRLIRLSESARQKNQLTFKLPPSNILQRHHVGLWAMPFHTSQVWSFLFQFCLGCKIQSFISAVDIKLSKYRNISRKIRAVLVESASFAVVLQENSFTLCFFDKSCIKAEAQITQSFL